MTVAASKDFIGPTYHSRYFGFRRPIIAANDRQRRHAERALDVLRFLGLIFAVFAAAAISKLVH